MAAQKSAAKRPAPKPVATPARTAPKAGTDDHYRARDAMHTLKEAERIKADPKLHAQAKAMAQQESAALKKIAGRK